MYRNPQFTQLCSGRIKGSCQHPYQSDVIPDRGRIDYEAVQLLEAKFSQEYSALTVRLQSARILHAIF